MPSIALMYHRISGFRPDPWTTSVSPENFDEQLQVLHSLSVPFTLTFDDGYADNLEKALPLLEKHELPATIFVTSGFVGSPYETWWDELERRYLSTHSLNWDWDDDDPELGATRYRELFHRSRLNAVQIYATRPQARPHRRMLNHSEVARLAAHPLITVGAHTMSHPVLSSLSPERQKIEIEGSKKALEEVTGRDVHLFAYPNGGHVDFGNETVQIVQTAGFYRAYAAWDGLIDQNTHLFQIPRVMVRNWNGDEFASFLHKKLSI